MAFFRQITLHCVQVLCKLFSVVLGKYILNVYIKTTYIDPYFPFLHWNLWKRRKSAVVLWGASPSFIFFFSPCCSSPVICRWKKLVLLPSPWLVTSSDFWQVSSRDERSVEIRDVIILDELWPSLLSMSADGSPMVLSSVANTGNASLAGQHSCCSMLGSLVPGS